MSFSRKQLTLLSIVTGLLVTALLFAGCTGTTTPLAPATPAPTPATTVIMSTPAPVATTAIATAAPTTAAPAATPAPVYTASPGKGNVVAFTAASLKGVSPKLAKDFSTMYPGETVVFNLDGTQALKTQVQNGAYCDVFISASNAYTAELTNGGYFVDGTVKPFATNYVIVILPAKNPANIQTLVDLAKPGIKIARADTSVPVGTATNSALASLAKTSLGSAWNTSVWKNTVTYETSEPAVATKVSLGEVDAGFVYESTAIAAPAGTYQTLKIAKENNYLQTYTIGVMKQSASKGAAADFETFMLSSIGQQDLKDAGFRPA